MSEVPFMPMYVAEFLADTYRLGPPAFTVYTRLLLSMWAAGGTLPVDEATLARIGGVSRKLWRSVAPEVLPYFDHDGVTITQGRLLFERQKVTSQRDSRRAAGALGGRARALKSNGAGQASASDLLQANGKQNPGKLYSRNIKEEQQESPPLGPPPPRPAPRKLGRRLPDDWAPGDGERLYAEEHGFGGARLERLTDDFRGYWLAKAGAGACKLDWSLTWQTWVRREADKGPASGAATPFRGRSDAPASGSFTPPDGRYRIVDGVYIPGKREP